MMIADRPTPNQPRIESAKPWVIRWLLAVAALVFMMVIVGGATRLTKSGLSITEWQPIMGALPPLNGADWQVAFEKYQHSSQYKLMNQSMSLGEFQFIFWWEWAHRLLGRLAGLVFLLPFLFFVFTSRMEKALWPRMIALFVIGGLQGALGWYMVASGLIDRVSVSQYRLAAHLTLASALFAAIIWVATTIRHKHHAPRNIDGCVAGLLVGLVVLQIAAGGFVAGLNAGEGYNTWPLMDGKLLPDGLATMQPVIWNIFENALTVQFDHRMLAYFILIIAVWHAYRTFSISGVVLAYLILTQACLGILTLLFHVPLGFALLHQATAMIVLAAAVWNLHKKTQIYSMA